MSGYKLACFDLDGTLVDDTEFFWHSLHSHYGVDSSITKQNYLDFVEGRIDYPGWCRRDLALLRERNATKEGIKEVIATFKPMQGAKETIEILRQSGIRIAVISGSVDIVLEQLFDKTLFDHIMINRMEFDDNGMLVNIVPTAYDMERKAEGLRKIAEQEGLNIEECAFIGDNHNDIEIAKIAGLAISFNSKCNELDMVANVVIKEKDMRLVIPLIYGK